jgi:hypothetical protein
MFFVLRIVKGTDISDAYNSTHGEQTDMELHMQRTAPSYYKEL